MAIELSGSDNSDFLKMHRRSLTGEAKWKDIEDLINRWARRNPRGAWENDQWLKQAKVNLKDKKYASKDLGRWGVSIHPELLQYIEAFYPNFLSTKDELHEFMKRFKKFRVPEVT